MTAKHGEAVVLFSLTDMTDWRTGYTVKTYHQVVIAYDGLAIDIAAAMGKVAAAAKLVEIKLSDDSQRVRLVFEEEREEGGT